MNKVGYLQVSGAVLARETLAKSGTLQETLRKLAEDAIRRNASFFVLPEGTGSCTALPNPSSPCHLASMEKAVHMLGAACQMT